ncbi:hypothetical protein A3F29_00490 [Candidatus Roizmanbacteria bacterium RIFCSPHIGHO2_12_FULL_33_9]|uniref:Glycosyltransferase 2-like domain-containing protein n=1 Tax=Candidatus Roizmanbacteria bacterium RIFCSPHIGHO2_12_FULL_33_9 TaxID=1802045 RepID=A0A1F7HGV3_9BACT|nr:MAG: hypothetical protein A3F29_00490 [Candidatus Roizmanbacteria bacterium RIFCSPHIGHO2_12_FULL_33_9]
MIENSDLPKISIVIVTYNNERTISKCVQYIESQNYPKDRIEYLNIDGGSTDSTEKILRNHSFRIVKSPIPHNAEAQRAIGVKEAKNNLIVSIDADNYLPSSLWLRQMVQPFVDNKEVIYAGTLYYAYSKDDSILNRYCALFGGLDPVVFYIGKPDRLSYLYKEWTKDIIKETSGYYLVKFTSETLPTVGCNGVVYKRDVLLGYAKINPNEFFHIDVFADLIKKGFITFAIIKNDVYHDTAISLFVLMKKRIHFLTTYFLNSGSVKRRYLIYNPKFLENRIRLGLFILYTVTLIKPFIDSIRGYIKIRDSAWFLHPLICWIFLSTYSIAFLKKNIKSI